MMSMHYRSFLLRYLAVVFIPVSLVISIDSVAADKLYSDRAEVREYIDMLVAEHQFNRAELLGMFRRAKRQQAVLDAISKPAEKKLSWAQYKPIFVTKSRAQAGVKFWRRHAETLERAQQRFGVPPEIIVAIIGVETLYGASKGKHPILDSLITLGFDGESRTGFFRRELTEFLLLAKDEQFNPFLAKGSYAGAMGIPQFISSSYRAYAVDFDNDGQRDLFDNPVDAIGSVANYFKRHGWRTGAVVSAPAQLKSQDASKHAVGKGRKGLKPKLSVAELRQAGVAVEMPVPPDELAVLLEFDGDAGVEHWLGFKNFYVITRYNISSMYAMAVYQLGSLIKQNYASTSVAANAAVSKIG